MFCLNVLSCVDREGPGTGPGSRVPFQRATSVDSKPFSGARGTGRRSAPSSLVKQESLDSHIGMGKERYSTLIEAYFDLKLASCFLNESLFFSIVF